MIHYNKSTNLKKLTIFISSNFKSFCLLKYIRYFSNKIIVLFGWKLTNDKLLLNIYNY